MLSCNPIVITPKSPVPTPTITNTFTPTNTSPPTKTFTVTATFTPTGTITPLVIGPYNCGGTDSTASFPPSGYLNLPYASGGFVPLCNGWVLLGNTTTDQIVLFNVLSQSVSQTFQLSNPPGTMAYDYANSLLYVGLAGTNSLARVNISNGAIATISFSNYVEYIIVGNSGQAFVRISNFNVALVDGVAGAALTTYSLTASYLNYDPGHQILYIDDDMVSPPVIQSFGFNSSTYALSLSQSVTFPVSYSYQMSVSPDGNHLAVQRSSPPISDLPASNLNTLLGSWNGYLPNNQSGDFTSDSQYFLTAFHPGLVVYSVASHTLSKSVTFNTGSNYFNAVGFSKGGGMVYGITGPSTGVNTAIYWSLFP